MLVKISGEWLNLNKVPNIREDEMNQNKRTLWLDDNVPIHYDKSADVIAKEIREEFKKNSLYSF